MPFIHTLYIERHHIKKLMDAAKEILEKVREDEREKVRQRIKVEALIIFLYAEMKRHLNDVAAILRNINRLAVELDIDNEDLKRLEKESEKYVEF